MLLPRIRPVWYKSVGMQPLREMRRAWVLLVSGMALLAGALAQEVTRNPKAAALTQPEVVRGRALFQTNCAGCHGPNAGGGMGPNLLASSLVRHDVKGSEIGRVVHQGRLEKGMPAFPQITDAQVADIEAFVHARIDASMRASALGASAFGGELAVGDKAAGQVYFQANCASCHDSAGSFKNIAARHDPAELEGLMLAPKTGRPTGTVSSGGAAIHGEVLRADSFGTTLRLPDGSVRTFGQDARFQPDDSLRAHRDLLSRYTNKDIHDVFAYLETLR